LEETRAEGEKNLVLQRRLSDWRIRVLGENIEKPEYNNYSFFWSKIEKSKEKRE
jgi:hypothetical protein